jgi:hypothetical protein
LIAAVQVKNLCCSLHLPRTKRPPAPCLWQFAKRPLTRAGKSPVQSGPMSISNIGPKKPAPIAGWSNRSYRSILFLKSQEIMRSIFACRRVLAKRARWRRARILPLSRVPKFQVTWEKEWTDMTDRTRPITIGVFAVQCCLSTSDDIGPDWMTNLLRKSMLRAITLLANRQQDCGLWRRNVCARAMWALWLSQGYLRLPSRTRQSNYPQFERPTSDTRILIPPSPGSNPGALASESNLYCESSGHKNSPDIFGQLAAHRAVSAAELSGFLSPTAQFHVSVSGSQFLISVFWRQRLSSIFADRGGAGYRLRHQWPALLKVAGLKIDPVKPR